MFEDIIKKEPSGMICCATCIYGIRARTSDEGVPTLCPADSKTCFETGKIKVYKDFERFNPTYRYSRWEPTNEIEN